MQCITTYQTFKNRQYAYVESFTESDVTLMVNDGDEGRLTKIPMKQFWLHWRVAYCTTLHSSQSITINEPLTIHEASRMTRRMLYTAISRATRWEYVLINAGAFGSRLTSITCVDEEEPEIKDYSQRIVGYIYHLIENDRVVYVGQTVNHERRFAQHKEGNYKDRDVDMVIIHEVRAFEDIDELERQEIDKFPAADLNNIRLNQCSQTVLVAAAAPAERVERGSYHHDKIKNRIGYKYYVNGKEAKKWFSIGKHGSEAAARKAAKEFAKTVFS
jgi:hypothetical protein